jgi:hypothetical protein
MEGEVAEDFTRLTAVRRMKATGTTAATAVTASALATVTTAPAPAGEEVG